MVDDDDLEVVLLCCFRVSLSQPSGAGGEGDQVPNSTKVQQDKSRTGSRNRTHAY